jgi:hypothetical protein
MGHGPYMRAVYFDSLLSIAEAAVAIGMAVSSNFSPNTLVDSITHIHLNIRICIPFNILTLLLKIQNSRFLLFLVP